MTWLITIARHRAIDQLRARRPKMSVELDHMADIPDLAPSAGMLMPLAVDGCPAVTHRLTTSGEIRRKLP